MTTEQHTDAAAERRWLTVNEIALMRAVVQYRRELAPHFPRADFYRRKWDMPNFRSVYFDMPAVDDWADAYAVLGFRSGRWEPSREMEVRTVTEAVDLAVVFGYLPARFSSAYRAGWDAAHSVTGTAEHLVESAEMELLPAHT